MLKTIASVIATAIVGMAIAPPVSANPVELFCQEECDRLTGHCDNYPLTVDQDNHRITVGAGASAVPYEITDSNATWIIGWDRRPHPDLAVAGSFRISINRNTLQIIIQPYDKKGREMDGDGTVAQCSKRQL